jgi:hypothetical protein
MPEVPSVDLEALPQLAVGELRLLWVNDWYDSPREAVVEHAGQRRLMILHPEDEVDVDRPMRWVLFTLSAEQWEEEERWHALFEQTVGRHWCFHFHDAPDTPDEAPPSLKPTDSFDSPSQRFRARYAGRRPRALDVRSATGWVDELPGA